MSTFCPFSQCHERLRGTADKEFSGTEGASKGNGQGQTPGKSLPAGLFSLEVQSPLGPSG